MAATAAEDRHLLTTAQWRRTPCAPAHHDGDQHDHRQRQRDRPGQAEHEGHGAGPPPPAVEDQHEVSRQQQHRPRLRVGQLQHRCRGHRRPDRHRAQGRAGRDRPREELGHQNGGTDSRGEGEGGCDRREPQARQGHHAPAEEREDRVEGPGVLLDAAVLTDGQLLGIAVGCDPLVPLRVPRHGQVDVVGARTRDTGEPHLLAGRDHQQHLAHDPDSHVEHRCPHLDPTPQPGRHPRGASFCVAAIPPSSRESAHGAVPGGEDEMPRCRHALPPPAG